MMGRATLMDVPSNATMRVRTAREAKARMRRTEILNSGRGLVSFVASLWGVIEEAEEDFGEVWGTGAEGIFPSALAGASGGVDIVVTMELWSRLSGVEALKGTSFK